MAPESTKAPIPERSKKRILPVDASEQRVEDSRVGSHQTPPMSYGLRVIAFLTTAVGGGMAIGLGWRIDTLAPLGILGFGLFLLGQFYGRRLVYCLLHAVVAGYLAFLLANPWLFSTLEGLMESATVKTVLITHGVHLFHGGMFVLFSIGWWLVRRHSWIDFVSAPAIWLICESVYPSMFPLRYGCFLIGVTPLIQVTSVLGVSAATLQMFFLASLVPLGWLSFVKAGRVNLSSRSLRYLVVGIILVTVANYSWGSWRINSIEAAMDRFSGDHLSVGVIQGETEYATFHSELVRRSRDLVELDHCDLVAWPECAFGKYERDLTDFSDSTQVALKSHGIGYQFRPLPNPNCYLLGGGHSWSRPSKGEDIDSRYASAYLLDADEQMVGRHDKTKLMAGGEYTPCASWFPQFADWLTDDQDSDDEVALSSGVDYQPLGNVKGLSIGAMLCCEDMYPSVPRKMTLAGADLLFCLTNGMAFDTDVALKQHFNIARFRAIETNRYMVRCGSIGVSCLVTPTGRVVDAVPCFEELDLLMEIPIEKRSMTIYCKWGESLPYVSVLVLISIGLFSFRRKP